jgi:hypothetical protein
VKDGQVQGYVKPLFRDMDVYDSGQDRHKPLLTRFFEGVVGGVSKMLENRPREEVATRALEALHLAIESWQIARKRRRSGSAGARPRGHWHWGSPLCRTNPVGGAVLIGLGGTEVAQ